MRPTLRSSTLSAAFVAFLVVLGACGSVAAQTPMGLSVRPASAQLSVGHSQQFIAVDTSSSQNTFGEARSIASGNHHTCALLANGTVQCWGDNTYGELGNGTSGTNLAYPVAVSGLDRVTAVATGSYHSCALISDGTVQCWGLNGRGQLGNQSRVQSALPVPVTGMMTATAIAAGGDHSCAVLTDGSARCWGSNDSGALGDGTTNDATAPVTVSNLSGATAITAGVYHTCALLANGTAQCWGNNPGNGSWQPSSTPVAVTGLAGATAIASGFEHTCALISDGTVSCWGYNTFGEVGPSPQPGWNFASRISGITGATAISASYGHTCALLADGTARCWGENSQGALGDGSINPSSTPVMVNGLSGATSITGGVYHACAILTDGTVSCWGGNGSGQLGNNGLTNSLVPVSVIGGQVLPITGVTAIAAGGYHTCAISSHGTLRCWGDNANGQLGTGTNNDSSVPQPLPDIVGATDVAAGMYHTCGVTADGRVQCWGNNYYGGLGDGTNTSSNRPVAVQGVTNAKSVVAGAYHSCALLGDGSVQCWGLDADGQLGDGVARTSSPAPLSVFQLPTASAIVAGRYHTCALLADGSVQCWGRNNLGQLGDGTQTTSNVPVSVASVSNAVAITAGTQHTCALLADGAVKCWGANESGQLGVSAGGFSATPLTSFPGGTGGNTGGGDTGGTSGGGPGGTGGNTGGGPTGGTTNSPGVTGITAGETHTCAELSNGTALCWGANGLGELGDGNINNSSAPKPVSGLDSVLSISAGTFFNCALQSSGTVQCWGDNTYGQLGHGSGSIALTPVPTQPVVDRVLWTSSSPSVATIDSSSGVAKGVSGGTTTITATYQGHSASANLTITVPTLQWILLAPEIIAIAPGASRQFTATGSYDDGSEQDLTAQVTWTSSNVNVATISATGIASGVAPGSTLIRATFGGQSGAANLSVSTIAAAQPITFNLSNVALKNGATITGSVTIDPSLGAATSAPVVFHNVTISPGATGMPAIVFDGNGGYAPDMAGYDPGYLAMWFFFGDYQLHLSVPYPFTTATSLPLHITPLHLGGMIGSNVSYCVGTGCGDGKAQYEIVSGWLDPQPSNITHAQNTLQFENNYFVTGDYVSRTVDLHGQTNGNGFASGTITIPDDKTAADGIPAGAEIVAAFLYWQSLENTPAPSSDTGSFRGYPMRGVAVSNDVQSACWATGNTQPTLRVYRANVLPFLPVANGVTQAVGTHTVSLAGTGNGVPQTLGANLVVIYRVLSPDFPLRAVVVYDGAQVIDPNTTLNQAIRGFYDSEESYNNARPAKYTVIRSMFSLSGPSWGAPTAVNPELELHGQAVNVQESWGAPGCEVWGATVLSTNVVNSDGDGILDAWKLGVLGQAPGSRIPGYFDIADGSWVGLPGAAPGQKDVFVQLDYMTGLDGHSHQPEANAVSMVQNAFVAHGIHLHVETGNPIPEETCVDDLTANPPRRCAFPGEPGVVAWKAGLEYLKGWPTNPADCIAGGACTPRFQHGRKDSYHYLLFAHSVAMANWTASDGSLVNIVVSGNMGTVTTSTANGCPARVTVAGALLTPNLNDVYDVFDCPTPTTFRIVTQNVADGTYPDATGLAEPALAVASGMTSSASGYSDIGGADTVVTLGKWGADADRINVQAGTLMHELGHTLGLMHGGRYNNGPSYVSTFGANCKPNYQSVMNYLFQVDLLGPNKALDFSGQMFNTLDESTLTASPGISVMGGSNPAYASTKWYSPYAPKGIGTPATSHCDGSPLIAGEPKMYEVQGLAWPIAWTNYQDINFDTSTTSVLRGYNDWSSVDLRQVGATGSDLPGKPTSSNGGILFAGGGGGILFAGGGGGILFAGGGGGILFAGGGGGILFAGGGGGILFAGGGGGMDAELTREAADSYVRPPDNLVSSTNGISWSAPTFGNIAGFYIYRSDSTNPLAFVPFDANVDPYTFTDLKPVQGGTYLVTTVLVDSRQSTTANATKYEQTITFSSLADRTYGDGDFPVTSQASSGLPVSFAAAGSCTVTGNMVKITGAGSCTLIASQPGDARFSAAPDVSRTFAIAKGVQVIDWANPLDIVLGTRLGTDQLNAKVSVSGQDQTTGLPTYSPPSETSLGIGPGQLLTVTVPATANYNAATATVKINVVYQSSAYTCGGDVGHTILPPIADRSVFKQGSTVPAKFRVCDLSGNSIGTTGVVAAFKLIKTISGTASDVNESVSSTTPDSAFRWDSSGQQWIFNISTKPLAKSTTYVYLITLNDGSTIQFQYGLK